MGLNAVILADVVGKADYGIASGLFMLGPVVGSSVVAHLLSLLLMQLPIRVCSL